MLSWNGHRFRRRTQQPGESIQEYVAALRELASSCSFVATDDSLRDQFLEGISSENLRECLLLEGSSLCFSRAVLLAQQLEQAAQQVRELVPGHVQQLTSRGGRFPRGSTRPRSSSQARSVSPERFSGSNNASAYCYRCGSHQHRASSSSCPAQGQRCFHCDRIGHFRSVCNRRQRHSTASVHEVDCQDLSSDAEGLSILTVTGPARAGIFVDVFIAGKSLKFLVDSGSSVSILEESIFKQHFANESLLSAPRVKLLDYSKGAAFPYAVVSSRKSRSRDAQSISLFYVVAEGTSILGIDAIRILDLHIEGSSLPLLRDVDDASDTRRRPALRLVPSFANQLPSEDPV
ncbi:hypothetical protein MTO96_036066 [Rhipicephalus appendiculatus]